MRKRIERWFKFRRNALLAWVDAWQLWLDQKRCYHTWRPARIDGKPARICRICEYFEEMDDASFYAHFGECAQGFLNRGKK